MTKKSKNACGFFRTKRNLLARQKSDSNLLRFGGMVNKMYVRKTCAT